MHRDEDHPDDRRHHSDNLKVILTAEQALLDGGASLEADYLAAQLTQPVGAAAPLVRVAQNEADGWRMTLACIDDGAVPESVGRR